MRDLKKHALEEYDQVQVIEQSLIGDSKEDIVLNPKLNVRYGLMQS
jgi:hypothetical protein